MVVQEQPNTVNLHLTLSNQIL